MHFFGTTGIFSFLIGGVIALWLIIRKLVYQANGDRFRAVTDQPLFYIALVVLVIGVLLFCTGFICEMVSRNAGGRNDYNIKEKF